MLDLFSIFSKGGIVLWCCQATNQSLTSSVNALIKSVILQERGGLESFNHEALTLKYQLDNEFDLVFVIGYQKFLQLSYVDKFLTDIQREFRDRYKNDLEQHNVCRNFTDFDSIYQSMLREAEESSKLEAKAPKAMKSFQDSEKSKKTVASMIERKDDKAAKGSKNKNKAAVAEKVSKQAPLPSTNLVKDSPKGVKFSMDTQKSNGRVEEEASVPGELDEETLRANRERLFQSKINKTNKSVSKSPSPTVEAGDNGAAKKKGKENRQWELNGKRNDAELNYSKDKGSEDNAAAAVDDEQLSWVGQSKGQIPNLEPEEESSSEEEEVEVKPVKLQSGGARGGDNKNKTSAPATGSASKGRFGFLSGLTNLVGSKTLTAADIEPVLDKMKHHLIAKNVASEIAENLCKSIATKLEGKVLGTFSTIAATVKEALNESCIQLLEPKKRVDILRDAMDAKQRKVPYTITFCGVNGVGKSTNLAKVCFWLIENGLRVLIAACDTFRAGAVEQLRTHCRKLNALHPAEMHGGLTMVQLYEKGYGKDAAGIAMEAIRYARDQRIDVVLVDTAGRMQDNEPLMRALAKLIKVNEPDLVLFVGEALVGNEAVDQLVKFNQALADHSSKEKPHLIDGIVLTKFDTIDDKVGAAISMTYITGQPIMFVGTGQTYVDLKNLNARSVVHSLLKA